MLLSYAICYYILVCKKLMNEIKKKKQETNKDIKRNSFIVCLFEFMQKQITNFVYEYF